MGELTARQSLPDLHGKAPVMGRTEKIERRGRREKEGERHGLPQDIFQGWAN